MHKDVISKHKLSIILLLLFSFSIPLHQKFSTLILVAFVAVALFNFKTVAFKSNLMILAVLYFIYVLFDVINYGALNFSLLEMKASLLAFPIIFSFIPYNQSDIKKACKGFVLGCFIALSICYIYACYQSVSFADGALSFSPFVSGVSNELFLSSVREGHYFFGSHFSIFHQTVYFALYLNIALILLLHFRFFSKMTRIFLIILFCIAIFQISNRINLFIALFSFTAYLFFAVKNSVFKWLFVASVLVVGLGIIITNPRIKQVYEQLATNKTNVNRESDDSLGARLLIWDASLDLIGEHLISGVGVTKSYEELKNVYKTKRYVIPYRHRLNAHNQFLQITIECGIIGLILLLTQFIYIPFIKKRLNFLTVAVLFVFLVNFLFESMLNRYSGIVCYSFFFCLLLLNGTAIQKREI